MLLRDCKLNQICEWHFYCLKWLLLGMNNVIKLVKLLGVEGALNLESQDVGLNLWHLALCPGAG